MSNPSRKRRRKNCCDCIKENGVVRPQVFDVEADCYFIYSPANRCADDQLDATQRSKVVDENINNDAPRKGQILKHLRQSPLTETDLDLTRSGDTGRKVDL